MPKPESPKTKQLKQSGEENQQSCKENSPVKKERAPEEETIKGQIESLENIHSDTELRSLSIKKRSRFARAFRSLSRSSRKKENLKSPPQAAKQPSPAFQSSEEDEDVQSKSPERKPKKKKKSFLLRGLKRSQKISPDYDIDIAEIKTEQTIPILVKSNEDLTGSVNDFNPSETLKQRTPDTKHKVQITISAKKVEQNTVSHQGTNSIERKEIEPGYLTPIEKISSSSEKLAGKAPVSDKASSLPAASKKKFKTKKITSVIALTQKRTQKEQKQPAATATILEEKIVITQSNRDIPPSEKAPTKPTRVNTITTQTTSNTGALNKPKSKTISSTNSNALSTNLNSQHISNNDSKKTATVQPSSNQSYLPNSFAKPSVSNKAGNKTSTVVNNNTKLMQNPTGTSQRGHRFPKPAEVLAAAAKQPQKEQKVPTGPNKIQKNSSSKQIQPKEAEKNQTLSNSLAVAKDRDQTAKSQIVDSTKPASQIDSASLLRPETILESSAIRKETSSQEDIVSSAESAQPSEYSFKFSSPNPKKSSATFIQKEAQAELRDSSVDSNSDSQSPSSEHTRRRIRYVASSIFDVYDSLTASTAIAQTEEAIPSEISINQLENDADGITKPKMSAHSDLPMDVQMQPAIMTSNNAEKREHLYKILVIGELGTGKTSFIKRYVHQFFSQNYRATIGVDFALKVLHWDANTIVRLQLWDIAGQERFGNMTRVYYKEAVGAFIVFDVTRSGTFDCVSKWKDDLDSKVQLPDGSPIPCILLANKCDQEKQGIVTFPEKMDEYVRDNGFAGWFETSAKENINIDEAARALVNKILLNDKLISSSDLTDSEKFNLNNTNEQNLTESKTKCSC